MPNYKPVLYGGVPLLNASGNPVIYDADAYPTFTADKRGTL